jgi:23S rRNA (cytidine2498-2'-O)-methyltransferase
LFITCQVGAEPAVKGELARRWPDFRFAYSRPGFLTFKLPPTHNLPDDFDLESAFSRAHGFTLGKLNGASNEELARAAWDQAGRRQYRRLHVWQRDERAAGDHGYEPGAGEAAGAARCALTAVAPDWASDLVAAAPAARPGELVLDCVLVNPGEWWLGYHRARRGLTSWEGGFAEIALPAGAASRAYLKMAEALRWSELAIEPGHEIVELGCAPGGSCQLLLSRGLKVVGIDPAAMHPSVLAHPNFTHLRKRAADVRRREFRKTRWLTADMNVAPEYTLDAVESIVTHPDVHIEGVLLTLKLMQWSLAEMLPDYLARIRSWGYEHVAARQLQHGRQEVCAAAILAPREPRRTGRQTARRRQSLRD